MKGWKPITLRAPVLSLFVFISLTVITLLEILYHRSLGGNGGGLAFASDLNSLPMSTTFLYLYLPTILAVLYSMMWSWVDLDVKRLEPWFQLSKQNGAAAKDSLCLQYPFDFLPLVPVNALRQKHWGVFFAGSIMLMVFWVITPLQSAIFNTGTVTRSVNVSMITTSQLVPIKVQSTALNANFLNTAYGISWLNQSLPTFSTPKYTVLPFRPYPMHQIASQAETWTIVTDAFSTFLSCSPANVLLTDVGYSFDNGKGCNVSEIELDDTRELNSAYLLDYIGYFNDANVDNALANSGCPPEFSNSFLALWASGASRNSGLGRATYNNLTALFCETNYHVEQFSVVLNASSSALASGNPTIDNPSSTVDIYSIFNTTTFEYIIGAGVMPVDQPINLPGRAKLSQFPQLARYNLTRELVNNMVQFAVALNPLTTEDLVAPAALHQAFELAHQLLFVTAFTSLLEQGNNSNGVHDSSSPGVVQDSLGAITFVRPVAIAVEAAFALVAVLALCLLYFTHQRLNKLERDPSSIGEIMSLLREHRIFPSSFDGIDQLTDKNLCSILADKSYYLLQNNIFHHDDRLSGNSGSQTERNLPGAIKDSAAATSVEMGFGDIPTIQPKELHLGVGTAFCAMILLTASGLVLLYVRSVQRGGLHLPTQNPVVLSILENYLPTAFATFFEPIWVILNRILCLLVPFEELRRGKAQLKSSLEAKYTSLPPQLVVWRALKSGHFLLAAVCLVAVSTNLLSVTLSTLLNESPVLVNLTVGSRQLLRPLFNNTSPVLNEADAPSPLTFGSLGYGHFYTLLSNLTHNTSLPAWVDEKYFYLPFNLDPTHEFSTSGAQLQSFTGSTTGLGLEVVCNTLVPGDGENEFLLSTGPNGTLFTVQTSHLQSDGNPAVCVSKLDAWPANSTLLGGGEIPLGQVALEIMQAMLPPPGVDDGGLCTNTLLAGWIRATNSEDTSANSSTFNISNMTFVACTADLAVAEFEVTVDKTGHILDSVPITNLSTVTGNYFTGNASEQGLMTQAINLILPTAPGTAVNYIDMGAWHSMTYTSDWLNSFLVIMQNSQALVAPSSPAPDGTIAAQTLKELYQELFSISLALTAQQIFPVDEDRTPFTIEATVQETRLFVSPVTFKISLALLLFHFIVAVLYYLCRPKKFLPRMPTTIAAIISYVYASRALDDFSVPREEKAGSERRYGFGRFIGTDSKTHVGIEKQRYVVPLETEKGAIKRKGWGLRMKRGDEKLPKP
ncbi:hypothetical protein N431DRAFT_420931 [Stipitochalara longipes BDJ]|nr:hypothetical protein N431DRAFT_420931 [Stipitochalara longipes BDJ]